MEGFDLAVGLWNGGPRRDISRSLVSGSRPLIVELWRAVANSACAGSAALRWPNRRT